MIFFHNIWRAFRGYYLEEVAATRMKGENVTGRRVVAHYYVSFSDVLYGPYCTVIHQYGSIFCKTLACAVGPDKAGHAEGPLLCRQVQGDILVLAEVVEDEFPELQGGPGGCVYVLGQFLEHILDVRVG